MASKVLVPAAPFAKLQVKKSPPEQSGSGGGFIISGADAAARVAHLEHSVRFLQEQHRLMLSGLHAEIEALRERNRDLQFQLIFNKESSLKAATPVAEEVVEASEEATLKIEVSRLEKEAAAARGEARAAEARALQLQRLVDAQTKKLRELQLATSTVNQSEPEPAEDPSETRAALRARLADAELLVRRLRADADRQRRELQCMKNSLHASLRATGLDQSYGFQNNYFPSVHAPEFWREPLREEYAMRAGVAGVAGAAAGGAGAAAGPRARRPVTLPELAGQQIHRATVYANNHTRPRANGFEQKAKKGQSANDTAAVRTPEEPTEHTRPNTLSEIPRLPIVDRVRSYPELKLVITRVIPHGNVSTSQPIEGGSRQRPRRHHHRKHTTEHT